MMSPRKLRLLAECLERNFITEEDRKSWVTDLRGMAKVMEWRQAKEKGDEGEMTWQPIETAPKGVWREKVTDPEYRDPPKLILFVEGEIHIGYWDWYYAEGGLGRGCTNGMAWVNDGEGGPFSSEPAYWMPLPEPPK